MISSRWEIIFADGELLLFLPWFTKYSFQNRSFLGRFWPKRHQSFWNILSGSWVITKTVNTHFGPFSPPGPLSPQTTVFKLFGLWSTLELKLVEKHVFFPSLGRIGDHYCKFLIFFKLLDSQPEIDDSLLFRFPGNWELNVCVSQVFSSTREISLSTANQ